MKVLKMLILITLLTTSHSFTYCINARVHTMQLSIGEPTVTRKNNVTVVPHRGLLYTYVCLVWEILKPRVME